MFEYNQDMLKENTDTVFRGMLDLGVNLGIIDIKQKNKIWVAWQVSDGNIKKFTEKELKKFVNPKQYKLLKARILK